MADDEQDPFGFLIDNCRYSSSQDELLTQVQFAREDEIFSDDDISPVIEDSRVSRRQLDETKKRHGGESTAVDADKDSARARNLGFGGERKLNAYCEEERRVKEREIELKKSKVSPSVEAKKKVEFGGDTHSEVMDVAGSNKEGDTEEEKLRQRKKKRELPRSMYESDWDVGSELGRNRRVEDGFKAATLGLEPEGNKQEGEIANNRNRNANANVESGVKKEASVNCKSNGTNKCILDALRLFVSDNDGGKVDFFETAKRCGMAFPRSRFLAEVEEND